jgi:hypothetical protein
MIIMSEDLGIFISYRSTRQTCAARLNEYLVAESGLVTWVDWERIGLRHDWRSLVARCIPSMDLLIAVGAREHRLSPHCAFEWTLASYANLARVRLEDAIGAVPNISGASGLNGLPRAPREGLARALGRYAADTVTTSHPCGGR